MRFVANRQSLRRILLWIQRALFGITAATIAYCGFVLVDAWSFQKSESRRLERLLADRREADKLQPPSAPGASAQPPPPASPDGLVGRLQIPRLGLSAIVMEGTTRSVLRRAVGHIEGTSLPGRAGNVGIAGHRDTFFRPLRGIRQNDVIKLTTPLGEYRYRVVSITIVKPGDVGVLNTSARQVLTLVTCYPFYFVGTAPDRFIVRAERVGEIL